jgi:hypothetical protein
MQFITARRDCPGFPGDMPIQLPVAALVPGTIALSKALAEEPFPKKRSFALLLQNG